MKHNPKRTIGRRDLFRVVLAGVCAWAAGTLLPEPTSAKSVDLTYKRRARYQAHSAEVRKFYRVNSYPTRQGGCPC
jgi:hypothetical protein